ncbi:MAG: flippase [Desulfobacteraceae bacterium]|nr:flippase [Desulfobacteraceae bacterium]MBC2749202.1 flippase [Desulfobacteraceae bacterium]
MKTHIHRIVKNIISLSIGNLLGRACGLVLVIVLARYLGPKHYGVYSLAFTYYMIMYFLTNLGLDIYYVKEASRAEKIDKVFFETNISLKLVSSIVSILIIIIVVMSLNYNDITKTAICFFSIALVFNHVSDTFKSLFDAKELMFHSSILELARSVVSLVLVIMVVYFNGNVLDALSMQIISYALSAILACLLVDKVLISLKSFRFNLINAKAIISQSIPFWYVTALFIINTRMDLLMISWMENESEVGLYSSAVELINVIMIVPMMINKAFFPSISRNFATDKTEMIRIANFGFKLSITLGVPIAFGCYILSPEIIHLVFGENFADAKIVLQILSINLFLQFGGTLLGWFFTATDDIRTIVVLNSVALIINITGNLLLIPMFGIAGAAITTVFARLFVSLVMNYLRFKKFREIKYFTFYGKPIIAAAVMTYCLLQIDNVYLPLTVMIGATIYFFTFVLMGGMSKEEYLGLKNFIKNDNS